MIISMRNNKNLLNKRERFKRGMGINGSDSKPQYSFPDATPQQIEVLRQQLQKENKRKQLQTNIATFVLLILIIAFIYLTVF